MILYPAIYIKKAIMKLTSETVYQYLHKRQLLDEEATIKGNFLVHPVKTRNYNMKIVIGSNNSLFIKQMETDMTSKNLFNREVATYTLFKNEKLFSSINLCVPSLLDFDDENNIIVTELVFNSNNLTEYYMTLKEFDVAIAEEQAGILSQCHIKSNGQFDTSKYPKVLPWVLQLNRYKANEFFANNPFSEKIIRLIKENDLLLNEIVSLSKSWQFTHLIHGDVKWINFLIVKNEKGYQQKLIDWELADIGDPLWDVAGLLQSYLATWVLGFDTTDPHSFELPDHMKSFDIKIMQPSAKAFLYKYLELQEYLESEHMDFFIKTMQLTAARIIQTSVEGVTFNSKIESNSMRFIQLAFNILKDPIVALDELFNIKIAEYV
jgi:thiamine kinase-like enzyme